MVEEAERKPPMAVWALDLAILCFSISFLCLSTSISLSTAAFFA